MKKATRNGTTAPQCSRTATIEQQFTPSVKCLHSRSASRAPPTSSTACAARPTASLWTELGCTALFRARPRLSVRCTSERKCSRDVTIEHQFAPSVRRLHSRSAFTSSARFIRSVCVMADCFALDMPGPLSSVSSSPTAVRREAILACRRSICCGNAPA